MGSERADVGYGDEVDQEYSIYNRPSASDDYFAIAPADDAPEGYTYSNGEGDPDYILESGYEYQGDDGGTGDDGDDGYTSGNASYTSASLADGYYDFGGVAFDKP